MSSRSSSARSTGSAGSRFGGGLLAVRAEERQVALDRVDALLVGVDLEVAHAGHARVDARAAQLLLGHVLAGDRLGQVRAGERHRAAALDHRHEVGQAGDVGGAGGARAHQRRDLRDHAARHHLLAEQVARAREQRAGGLLDARAGRVEQPDHRDALAERQVAQARDLHLAGHAHRAGHHGEVVGGHGDQAAVDLAVAGDDAVGRRLLALHRALREVRAPVDAELDERALVDQQRQPLARGELVLLVLAGDPLLAAARRARARRSCRSSTSDRSEGRATRLSAAARSVVAMKVGSATSYSCASAAMRSSTGSSTRIAVSAASASSSGSSGASKAVTSRPTSSESSATASIRS